MDGLHLAVGAPLTLDRSQASTWTQRTHIWSSSVRYVGWDVTLPTRFETKTERRPLTNGTTGARSTTRRSTPAHAAGASSGAAARALRIAASSPVTHRCETFAVLASPRALQANGGSSMIEALR